MVTGNNTIELSLKVDQGLNRESLKDFHSVLSLSKTGFSIIIASGNKQDIRLSAHAHWPSEKSYSKLIARFEQCLDQIPVQVDLCQGIRCLVNFQKFSLVPEHLYQKGEGQTLLSYTAKLQKGDHIYTDHWVGSESILIHALPVEIIDWIKKRFPQALVHHQSTAIEALHQLFPKGDFSGILYVDKTEADFFLANKAKLQWYNKFEYQTEEDLLYFILYCLEQNRFLPTELQLKIGGHSLKGDKLRQLLDRYISDVKDLPIPSNFKLSPMISEKEMRENINLLGILWRALLAENSEASL